MTIDELIGVMSEGCEVSLKITGMDSVVISVAALGSREKRQACISLELIEQSKFDLTGHVVLRLLSDTGWIPCLSG